MASDEAAADTAQPPPTAEGEATLLVSEFPPPPFYYHYAAAAAGLQPPPIPTEALARGTRKAAAAAAHARAEAERLRMEDMDQHGDHKTHSILGGATQEQQQQQQEEEDGDVVAVFGEIVEDPDLVEPLDHCEDPGIVRDEVKRLNHEILQRFVKLVQDLVHQPLENKKTRDDLLHGIFLMLQECNKFREHQARELMIELLEHQLEERRKLVQILQSNIAQADELLLLPSSAAVDSNKDALDQ